MNDTNMAGWRVAAGSVVGAEHLRLGRGNQDAFCFCQREGCLVAVVADGCGSGASSEVGARLGARLLTQALVQGLEDGRVLGDPSLFWRAQAEVLAELKPLARAMGGSLSQVVADYFLFTLVGFAITEVTTAVFGAGDGVFAVNGEVTSLGPFPGNQPPYLGYALLPGAPESPLVVHRLMPTSDVRSLLAGTDGCLDLDRAAAERGGLPSLEALADEPRLTENPDALRRALALLGRERVLPEWESRRLRRERGLLPDDTTLVCARREVAPGRRTRPSRPAIPAAPDAATPTTEVGR